MKDSKVMPDPIDDRKLQEWKESGKSGIRRGIVLKPRKWIGINVNNTPININIKCNKDKYELDDNIIVWVENIYDEKYNILENIDIMAPKDNTKWKWPGI